MTGPRGSKVMAITTTLPSCGHKSGSVFRQYPDRRAPRRDRHVRSQNIHKRGPAGGYVDQIAVKRCLAEQLVPLTPGELHAAIDRLDEDGLSAKQIARQLGCADRTVTRRRAARRRQTEGTQS